jgi:hypothetical protein
MKQKEQKKMLRWFWFKQAAIYPPSFVLFFSLFGLIYLLNYNMLLSGYAIPFIILFLAGAVWLKMVKRYIEKQMKNEK